VEWWKGKKEDPFASLQSQFPITICNALLIRFISTPNSKALRYLSPTNAILSQFNSPLHVWGIQFVFKGIHFAYSILLSSESHIKMASIDVIKSCIDSIRQVSKYYTYAFEQENFQFSFTIMLLHNSFIMDFNNLIFFFHDQVFSLNNEFLQFELFSSLISMQISESIGYMYN
jgi:hypothetical protein